MLRIQELGKGAAAYFGAAFGGAEYYTEGAQVPGQWHGQAAERLGLRGTANAADFAAVMAGLRPGGAGNLTQRLRSDRRPGYDCCFDVPKSASILAGVAGDDRIAGALHGAAEAAMARIESAARARVRKAAEREREDRRREKEDGRRREEEERRREEEDRQRAALDRRMLEERWAEWERRRRAEDLMRIMEDELRRAEDERRREEDDCRAAEDRARREQGEAERAQELRDGRLTRNLMGGFHAPERPTGGPDAGAGGAGSGGLPMATRRRGAERGRPPSAPARGDNQCYL